METTRGLNVDASAPNWNDMSTSASKEESDDSKPQQTDANMSFTNNQAWMIKVDWTRDTAMSDKFPSDWILESVTKEHYIRASDAPIQSNFDLNVDGKHLFRAELGRGIYNTGVVPSYGQDGTNAWCAHLQPINPLSTETDWDFRFFYGRPQLATLVNSILRANVPAMIKSIRDQGKKFGDVTLKFITFDGPFYCRYGAYTFSKGIITLTMLFEIAKVDARGEVDTSNGPGDFVFSLTNAYVWTKISYNINRHPKLSIEALRISVGSYHLDGSFIDLAAGKWAPWLRQLRDNILTPYRFAGAFNTTVNKDILDMINKAIGSAEAESAFEHLMPFMSFVSMPLGGSVTPPQSSSVVTNDTAASESTQSNGVGVHAVSDNPTWMSTPNIQGIRFKDLKILGTHDSATSNLSFKLSQMPNPDIDFLWNLSDKNAPEDGQWPFPQTPSRKTPVFLGSSAHDFVMKIAHNLAVTQTQSFFEQLQYGIRHFDVRVYWDTDDNELYTQHGLRGPKFEDVLNQFKSFLDKNPTASELIFVQMKNTNFSGHPERCAQVTALIQKVIPTKNVYSPGTGSFNFETLKDLTVAEITQGMTKIMFLNGDAEKYSYDQVVTNSTGYPGLPYTGDVYDVDALMKREGDGLQNNTKELWSVAWVMGQSPDTAIPGYIWSLLAKDPAYSLLPIIVYSGWANTQLPWFFSQYKGSFNLLNVDSAASYVNGGANSLMEYVIKMNS